MVFQGCMDGEIMKTPPRGKKSPSRSPSKKKTKTIKDIKRSPIKKKAPKRKRNAREVLVVAQAFKNHRLWECLQKLKVIDAPDQVSKLEEFIKNAQGAALSRGMDIQPAVAALSRETALVEEERRRLEEERKGLEAERAEHQRLLDKYRPLLPLEAEMQTELEEARKERSELNTKLRQVRRTQNKLEASITFYDKLREKNRNEPCIYCQQPSGDRDSRRVCGACVLETEEAQRAFEAQHPEVELA